MRTLPLAVVSLLAVAASGCLEDTIEDPTGLVDEEIPMLPPALEGVVWKTDYAPMPIPLTEHGVGALKGKIITVTGMTEDEYGTVGSTNVQVYDPATDAWSRGPDYPLVVNHISIASDNEVLYATGGLGPFAFRLDDPAGPWVPLPPMPGERAAHGSAIVDGKLYTLSGGTDATMAAVWMYDPGTNMWSVVGDPQPEPRDHTSAAALDGKIYVIGGDIGGHDSNTDTNEIFDVATGKWSQGAPLPQVRGSLQLVAYRGLILTIGGQNGTMAYDYFEAYDPSTDTWTILDPLPLPRHGFGAAVLDDRVWVAAGGHEPGSLPGQQASDDIHSFGPALVGGDHMDGMHDA